MKVSKAAALAVAILATVFIVPVCLAGVIEIQLETEGTGESLQAAIQDALILAVGQVNGMEIAASTRHSVAEVSAESKNDKAYLSSESFSQHVQTSTKGLIKSFRILQAQQNQAAGNLWVARVASIISKYETSEQVKRLRMAVLPFRVASTVSEKELAAGYVTTLLQELTGFLTQTRKFAILDRSHLQELDNELKLTQGNDFPTEEMARWGNRVGTDYLIVGSIDNYRESRWQQHMKSTGKVFNLQQVDIHLGYRIIDVATGQIKFADSCSYKTGTGQASGDMALVARKTASTIGEKILNAIYPITVASVHGKTVYLSQGGGSLQIGQHLDLVQLGSAIIDPYTKESLGREEVRVGEIEITDVQAKLAQGVIVRSAVNMESAFTPGNFIVRPLAGTKKPPESAAVSAKPKKAGKPPGPLQKTEENEW